MPLITTLAGASARGYGGLITFGVPGSYESIATVTVGSGGASDITFTSIPATYTHLQIRGIARSTSQTDEVRLQFNTDTGTNYSWHQIYGSGSTTGVSATTTTGNIKIGEMSGTNFPSNTFGGSVCDILDYANANKYKTTRALTGADSNGVGGYMVFVSGNWRSTSAITSIKLFMNTGNFVQYSQFSLYGIRGA